MLAATLSALVFGGLFLLLLSGFLKGFRSRHERFYGSKWVEPR